VADTLASISYSTTTVVIGVAVAVAEDLLGGILF
ncbi:hypothetical protein Tco_0043619, partial [Tanacetum coccineum]